MIFLPLDPKARNYTAMLPDAQTPARNFIRSPLVRQIGINYDAIVAGVDAGLVGWASRKAKGEPVSGKESGVSESGKRTTQGADYENVGSDYMEQRQLRKGAAGWVLLAGLGVAYVISGDFAGWHFGLGVGGWGGLLIATVLMATMYTTMVFALAELSSTIPTAGAGIMRAGS